MYVNINEPRAFSPRAQQPKSFRTAEPHYGRFLQPDPIGYGSGMNMYDYVAGDPVNFKDPLGLTDVQICAWQIGGTATVVEQEAGTTLGYGRGGRGGSGGGSWNCTNYYIPDHTLYNPMTPYPPTGGYPPVNIAAPHQYIVNTKVASADQCSAAQVAEGLGRHAVPGVPSTQPIQSGNNYFARDQGAPFNPGGWVRSTMEGSLHYRNQTLEGHPLHNGSVDRIAYQSGGDWYVATIGVGVNSTRWMAAINEWRGPAIFKELDADLEAYLGSSCGNGGEGW